MSSVSVSQSAAGGIWSQLQQQQAQRTAEQAETKARALKMQADQAAMVADQAAENARSTRLESRQAEGDVRDARMNLASLESLNEVRGQLGEMRKDLAPVSTAASSAGASPAPQPVVNAQGQTTGVLLSVTA